MAVVKVSYTRDRGKVKAHLRYITHRPGKDNARTTRALFNQDGQLTKGQAYELIDHARKGTTFFRIMLSPDPAREDAFKDLNLRELTLDALLALQKRLQARLPHFPDIQFLAAEHADHRPHRHVHLIALIQGRLTKADINALRAATTELARSQRRERDLARGAARSPERMRSPRSVVATSPKYIVTRPWRGAPTCPRCQGGPEMQWRPGNRYACAHCELSVSRNGWSGPALDGGWGL